jgi:hypothetical protein
MRVGVIRNDLRGPLLIADLESVSNQNVPVDPPGQVRYLSLPTAAGIEALLAGATTGAGATITGTALTFNIVIDGTNNLLRLRTSSTGTLTNYTIASGTYTNITTLVAAINTALFGSGVRAFNGGSSNVVLESTTHGVGSYLENASVANDANTILNIADGVVRTMPAASAYLTAAGVPGGPLNVSAATLAGVGAGSNTNALTPHNAAGLTRGLAPLQDYIAPNFADTPVAIDSFLYGMLSEYRSANFNPDTRNPAETAGAAIAVVESSGSTAYATAHTVPTITSATVGSPSTGAVTIAGTGLGNENGSGTLGNGVIVKFTGAITKRLEQKAIIRAGGSVLPTAIVIPASLIPGAAATTVSVRVQVRQRLSNTIALV